MATAARRVRLSRRGKVTEPPIDTSQLTAYIDEVITLDEKNAANSAKREQLVAVIAGLMGKAKLNEIAGRKGEAKYVSQTGNSKTFIDPAKFRKAVKDDAEFYSAVSVGVTAAKKILPEKALAKISTVTPGESKPDVLRVSPLISKKK